MLSGKKEELLQYEDWQNFFARFLKNFYSPKGTELSRGTRKLCKSQSFSENLHKLIKEVIESFETSVVSFFSPHDIWRLGSYYKIFLETAVLNLEVEIW